MTVLFTSAHPHVRYSPTPTPACTVYNTHSLCNIPESPAAHIPYTSEDEPNVRNTLPILFEDQHFIVTNKPHFLPIDSICPRDVTVHTVLEKHTNEIQKYYQVHQLDVATSGIFILATHKTAASEMGRLFVDRQVTKTYIAILHGTLPVPPQLDGVTGRQSWLIESYVQEIASNKCSVVPDPDRGPTGTYTNIKTAKAGKGDPQFARTIITPLAHFIHPISKQRLTLVKLHPITGRRHQLRVHCDALGHTIFGDWTYEKVKSEHSRKLHLHAYEIAFTLPDKDVLAGTRRRNPRGKLPLSDLHPVQYHWKTSFPWPEFAQYQHECKENLDMDPPLHS